MIIISKNQINALSEQAKDKFREKLCQFVKDFFRDKCSLMSDEEIKEFIILNHEAAMEHGIYTERGVSMWVFLIIATNSSFYENNFAKDALKDKSMAEKNLENIFNHLSLIETRQRSK